VLEAGAGAEQGVRIPPTEKDKKYCTQIIGCDKIIHYQVHFFAKNEKKFAKSLYSHIILLNACFGAKLMPL
jgi:hypothetical protein